MNREALWSTLTEACSEHGYLTDHTYDLIDAVIDSIRGDDPLFKIGDRVRVVNNESGRVDYTGKVGTVTGLEQSFLGGEIFVTWDPESGAWCFMPSELVKTDEG